MLPIYLIFISYLFRAYQSLLTAYCTLLMTQRPFRPMLIKQITGKVDKLNLPSVMFSLWKIYYNLS